MDYQKVFFTFFVICAASVQSIPFTIDVLENRDIIFPRRSELVKRTASNDVSELNQQKISLSSFIENIETGILQTALSVDPLAIDSHAEVQNLSTPHPVEKLSTAMENDEPVDNSTPLVLVQTTENVPAVNSVPSHVVIDRVSVFKAPDVGSGLFPTFLVQDTNVPDQPTEVILDDDEKQSTTINSAESSESEESTESNDSFEEKPTKVNAGKEPPSTASSSPSSTTSLEEIKKAEKEA